MRRILHALAILPIVTACSMFSSWHNPNLPPAQEAADERQCRREAEDDMGPQVYSAPGDDRPQTQFGLINNMETPSQMADRDDARQQYGRLVADCMERKGYLHND